MGVPKFYRWISERYPCLSEVVKEYQIPEFDNLYLDMNGIIHNCSHPEDDNVQFRITEDKIFSGIFHYIEILFRMIKPRKVFFMAIDGVAPRAKMNQQRGRRFRTAREAENLEKKAIEKGQMLPKEARFDSNCITPGTEFMARLQEQLKYFVVHKVSTDKLWHGVNVYLSGHLVPGEGEHKIMDFIRSQKAKTDYDPNTRHCLYGLDADLIMLGLTSHEPHFSLLREEVKFGARQSQKRTTSVEETTFHLLHLSLMREYLDFEFSALKATMQFAYNLESIIDDWVLMGFLVGNDFIPHLPHLHIQHDALPLIWKAYMDIMPTLDGYLNEGGSLNLRRFEAFLRSLSKFDLEKFSEHHTDLKWLEGKRSNGSAGKTQGMSDQRGAPSHCLLQSRGGARGRRFGPGQRPGVCSTSAAAGSLSNDSSEESGVSSDVDVVELELLKIAAEHDTASALGQGAPPRGGATGNDNGKLEEQKFEDVDCELEEEEEDDEGGEFAREFREHKSKYYQEKMEYDKVTPDVLASQAMCYVTGIQWILRYYYDGVPSWSWYYPHHYAPFLSDVRGFADATISFELGEPFLPFQQLMAVLPAASRSLLPACYQGLMINDTSPIVGFYPVDFRTDLNGKQQDWEAVVLIPFINEILLLEAMSKCEQYLTDSERQRNSRGTCLLYQHSATCLGTYASPLPSAFPDVLMNHCAYCEVSPQEFAVPADQLKKGLCENVRLDVYFPGFPTLRHLLHRAYLQKASVRVFQMPSRGESMIVELLQSGQMVGEQTVSLDRALAQDLLDRTIWVGWPHLVEARVVSLASDEVKYYLKSDGRGKGDATPLIVKEAVGSEERGRWVREMNSISEQYKTRLGVDIGETSVLVYATPVSGKKYEYSNDGGVVLCSQWASQPVAFALQATVRNITVHESLDGGLLQRQPRSLGDLYPAGSRVFMLGTHMYGSVGEVTKTTDLDGRIHVNLSCQDEPDLNTVRQSIKDSPANADYQEPGRLAQGLGMSAQLLSRITGTVFVTRGGNSVGSSQRFNIGLDLKRNKSGEECPGFTKKVGTTWLYSSKVADVLRNYMQKFPRLFEKFSKMMNEDTYRQDDLFDGSRCSASDVVEYLASLPTHGAQRVRHGTALLDSSTVLAIEREIAALSASSATDQRKQKKISRVQLKPHHVYCDFGLHTAPAAPDVNATYELLDRVVNVREGHTVPVGLRGTVIGMVQQTDRENDILYEVLFDEAFAGGMTIRSSPSRTYRVQPRALINISHGARSSRKQPPFPAPPTVPSHANSTIRGSTGREVRSGNGREDHERVWNTLMSAPAAPPKEGAVTVQANKHNTAPGAVVPQPKLTGATASRRSNEPRPSSGSGLLRDSLRASATRPGAPVNQSAGVCGTARANASNGLAAAVTVSAVSVSQDVAAPPSGSLADEKESAEFDALLKALEAGMAAATATGPSKEEDIVQRKISVQELFQSVEATAVDSSKGRTAQTAEPVGRDPGGPVGHDLGEPAGQDPGALVYCGPGAPASFEPLAVSAMMTSDQPLSVPSEQPIVPAHPMGSNRSLVKELADLHRSCGLPLPSYEVSDQTENRFLVSVTLPNGVRFQGSRSASYDHAAESAAGNAMIHLKSGVAVLKNPAGASAAAYSQPPPASLWGVPGAGHFLMPRAPYAPSIYPAPFFGQPVPVRTPYPYRPDYAGFHQGIQPVGLYAPNFVIPRSDVGEAVLVPTSPAKGWVRQPFVPLQVTKKQIVSGLDTTKPDTASIATQDKSPVLPLQQAVATSDLLGAALEVKEKSHTTEAKSRSRLAANFNRK